MGSRGSIIPFFLDKASKNENIPITDSRMTRFMITLEQGVDLVWRAFEDMVGGEIYVKKIPSMKVTDIATAISKKSEHDIVGIRPGEKLHEQMIGEEDVLYTFEYDDYYKILPSINGWSEDNERIKKGIRVDPEFTYCSNNNKEWMSPNELQDWIKENQHNIGEI